jgi:hypothetical protein
VPNLRVEQGASLLGYAPEFGKASQ